MALPIPSPELALVLATRRVTHIELAALQLDDSINQAVEGNWEQSSTSYLAYRHHTQAKISLEHAIIRCANACLQTLPDPYDAMLGDAHPDVHGDRSLREQGPDNTPFQL